MRSAALAAALVLALSGPAFAQADDPVVAKVGSDEIRKSEVNDLLALYGDELRGMPPQVRFETALDRAVDSRLMTQAAKKANVDDDPEFKRQQRILETQLLQRLYVNRILKEAAGEASLRAAYDKLYNGGKGMPEVRARHILVDSKAKAEQIIKELDGGTDFAQLAGKHSSDSTSKRGGDLGFFGRDDMVKPFADAAFALKPGSYTKTPVESEFGWHVIKVEETKTEPAPAFDKVRSALEQRAGQAAVVEMLEKLRKDTNIQITDAGKAASGQK